MIVGMGSDLVDVRRMRAAMDRGRQTLRHSDTEIRVGGT